MNTLLFILLCCLFIDSQHKPSFGLFKTVGSSATPSTQQSLFSSKPICNMSKPTEPMVKRQLNFKVNEQIKLEPDADGELRSKLQL